MVCDWVEVGGWVVRGSHCVSEPLWSLSAASSMRLARTSFTRGVLPPADGGQSSCRPRPARQAKGDAVGGGMTRWAGWVGGPRTQLVDSHGAVQIQVHFVEELPSLVLLLPLPQVLLDGVAQAEEQVAGPGRRRAHRHPARAARVHPSRWWGVGGVGPLGLGDRGGWGGQALMLGQSGETTDSGSRGSV